jgi:hypothetical protein
LTVDTTNSLVRLDIEDAPEEYVWDGIEIPPGASLVTKKLMPDDHYFVKVEVVAEDEDSGVFDLEFWTPHAKFIRVPLVASVGLTEPLTDPPPPRYRYWSTVTLETESDTKTWFDDRQLITESEFIFGPRPPLLNPVSLTQFYVTDSVAWRESVESTGVITAIDSTTKYTIESPSVDTSPGYYESAAGPLVIKNTGSANLNFVSIEVLRIRGLIDTENNKSLSFIEPDPLDDVPNPTCTEHFPECWDVEQPYPPVDVAITPNATIRDERFENRGCGHESTWISESPSQSVIDINQYTETARTATSIHSGTDIDGVSWDLMRYEFVQEDSETQIPSDASTLYGTTVTVNLVRSSEEELDEEDNPYFPWVVNSSIQIKTLI